MWARVLTLLAGRGRRADAWRSEVYPRLSSSSALSFDNIVLSDRLCIDNPCRTLPLFLFGRGGSVDTPPPSTFALGVVGLAVSLGALAVAATTWAAARRLTVRTA